MILNTLVEQSISHNMFKFQSHTQQSFKDTNILLTGVKNANIEGAIGMKSNDKLLDLLRCIDLGVKLKPRLDLEIVY